MVYIMELWQSSFFEQGLRKMDTLLLILGALGLLAILISAYVFTVAARNYVSEEDSARAELSPDGERRQGERRSDRDVEFPMDLDGMQLGEDRRRHTDRRENLL